MPRKAIATPSEPPPKPPPKKRQRPRRFRRQRDFRMVVVFPDIHFGHADKGAISAILRMCKDYQPDEVIQLGDLIDAKALGRWPKSPEDLNGLQEEFDEARTFWANVKTICPKAKLVQLEGNHEHRLQKCLWERAGLHSLRDLTVPNLMKLHEFGVHYYKRHERYWISKDLKLLAMHGNQTNAYGGYSAKNEVDKRGVNFIAGHVHRLALSQKSTELETLLGIECGHLTLPSHTEWLEGKVANWQQGFVVLHLFPTWFHPTLVPITHGRFCFEGKVYSCD